MATIEKVGIEIVGKLDKSSFQKAEDDIVHFARDTKKKLDPLLVQDLRLNLANLQMRLDEARNKLKQAKKE
jgi:flavin-binding protein dodecin